MKTSARQQNLGIADPLDKISFTLFFMKESLKDLRKQTKEHDSLLKEASALLAGIKETFLETRQGELFNNESEEDAGNAEYRNEVFEELRDLLGNKQAEKVADYFSGSLVYFSKGVALARKHREIKKAFWEGASCRELAVKHGYTEQHIRRIIHEGGKSTAKKAAHK